MAYSRYCAFCKMPKEPGCDNWCRECHTEIVKFRTTMEELQVNQTHHSPPDIEERIAYHQKRIERGEEWKRDK